MFEFLENFINDFWQALKGLLADVFMAIFDAILSGIAYVIESIPLPDFITDYSLADFIHADIGYFLTMSGFPDCLAVIGSAYVFRLIRRVVTLGIW